MEISDRIALQKKIFKILLHIVVLGGIGWGVHGVLEPSLKQLEMAKEIQPQDEIFIRTSAVILAGSLPWRAYKYLEIDKRSLSPATRANPEPADVPSQPESELAKMERILKDEKRFFDDLSKRLADDCADPPRILLEVTVPAWDATMKLPNGLGKTLLLLVYGWVRLMAVLSILISFGKNEPWKEKAIFTAIGLAILYVGIPAIAFLFIAISIFEKPIEFILFGFVTLCLFAAASLLEEKLSERALSYFGNLLKLPKEFGEEPQTSEPASKEAEVSESK